MFDRYFRLHCMDFFLVCSCLNMFFRSLNYMFLRCLFFSMWLKLFLVMRLLLRFLHFMFNLGLHFVGNLVMLFHNCLGMLFIMWLNGCMDTVFFCMVLVLVFLFGSLFFFWFSYLLFFLLMVLMLIRYLGNMRLLNMVLWYVVLTRDFMWRVFFLSRVDNFLLLFFIGMLCFLRGL